MYKRDIAKFKSAPWLTSAVGSTEYSYPDNSGVSSEEGLTLVKAFVSIRNPALRQALVKFIEEMAKATTSLLGLQVQELQAIRLEKCLTLSPRLRHLPAKLSL